MKQFLILNFKFNLSFWPTSGGTPSEPATKTQARTPKNNATHLPTVFYLKVFGDFERDSK